MLLLVITGLLIYKVRSDFEAFFNHLMAILQFIGQSGD